MFNFADCKHLLPKAVCWLVLAFEASPYHAIAQAIEPLQPKHVAINGIFNAAPIIASRNISNSTHSNAKVSYRNNNIRPPLLVLDGQIISEEQLLLLDPNKIKSIEVIKKVEAENLFCSSAFDGALIIKTK